MIDNTRIVIINRGDDSESIPFFCPVCDLAMRTSHDQKAFLENECCNECFMVYVEPFRDKWERGWRPSRQEIEKRLEATNGKYVIDLRRN